MNPRTYPSNSLGTSRVYGEFLFTAPTAGTTVSLATVDGIAIVASITHTPGNNILTVTLSEPVFKVIKITAEPRDDAATGGYCTVGTVTNEGTKNPLVFNINYFTNAGAASNNPSVVTQVDFALKLSQWGTGVK